MKAHLYILLFAGLFPYQAQALIGDVVDAARKQQLTHSM